VTRRRIVVAKSRIRRLNPRNWRGVKPNRFNLSKFPIRSTNPNSSLFNRIELTEKPINVDFSRRRQGRRQSWFAEEEALAMALRYLAFHYSIRRVGFNYSSKPWFRWCLYCFRCTCFFSHSRVSLHRLVRWFQMLCIL
jgi:hypothetical protein